MKTTIPQNSTESASQILILVSQLIKKSEESHSIGGWVTQKRLKNFLEYGSTTMRELEKSGVLKFSTIGRKKFIKLDDVVELLEKNIDK